MCAWLYTLVLLSYTVGQLGIIHCVETNTSDPKAHCSDFSFLASSVTLALGSLFNCASSGEDTWNKIDLVMSLATMVLNIYQHGTMVWHQLTMGTMVAYSSVNALKRYHFW
jgi:hypothetical protein